LKRLIWRADLISPGVPSASPAVSFPFRWQAEWFPRRSDCFRFTAPARASCCVARILPLWPQSQDHCERLEPLIPSQEFGAPSGEGPPVHAGRQPR
jgi:hypothetical protein